MIASRNTLDYHTGQTSPPARRHGGLLVGWTASGLLLVAAFFVGLYYSREEPFHTGPPQTSDVLVLVALPVPAMCGALACALWGAVTAIRLRKPAIMRVLLVASLVLPQVPLQHLYLYWMTQYRFEVEWYRSDERLWPGWDRAARPADDE